MKITDVTALTGGIALSEMEGWALVHLGEAGFLHTEPGEQIDIPCVLRFTPTPEEYEQLRKALKLPTRKRFQAGAKTVAMKKNEERKRATPFNRSKT